MNNLHVLNFSKNVLKMTHNINEHPVSIFTSPRLYRYIIYIYYIYIQATRYLIL